MMTAVTEYRCSAHMVPPTAEVGTIKINNEGNGVAKGASSPRRDSRLLQRLLYGVTLHSIHLSRQSE